MTTLIIAFAVIILLKFFSNFQSRTLLQRYEKEFMDFLADETTTTIQEHKIQTIEL